MEHSTPEISGCRIYHSRSRRDTVYGVVIIAYFSQEVGAQGRCLGPGCEGSLD